MFLRQRNMKFREEHPPGSRIFQAIKKFAHNRKGTRNNAAGNAGVYGVRENFHLELEADDAAKAARQPETMVVADSEVKNREDAGVAAARRDLMQVGAKILGP